MDHKNGIKDDNVDTNLEWCDHQYNLDHARALGLINDKYEEGERNHEAKPTVEQVINIWHAQGSVTLLKVAHLYGMSESTVHGIWHGKRWKHLNLKPMPLVYKKHVD